MKKLIAFILIVVIFIGTTAFATDAYTYKTVYPEDYIPTANIKTVYLTFDDGPTKYTTQILDILAQHDVPATFFVVGNREHTHLMGDIVEMGHSIGLHSYNHDFDQIYSSKDAFFADLKKIDDIVYDQTGVRSNIIRFPGGSSIKRGASKSTIAQIKKEIALRGYQFFDWNCDSRDKMGIKTASGAFSKIKAAAEEVGDFVVVLMHDTEEITVEYLPRVIEYFKALDYVFLPISAASPAIHHTW
ncbi:MAG: polysaccharide deacetylase [Defluviitaleaceae bacterium]|nr:polysaccharide deacetylase [Defluviitaleaceae bacterium]